MKTLLALIENELRKVDTVVTCPICGKKQSFELSKLSKVRLGREGAYTGTGGMPAVQCEHCKKEGITTVISLNGNVYNDIQNVVINAVLQQPATYIDADYKDTNIVESK